MSQHIRFHIERGYCYDANNNATSWTRETIAGQRTITAARRELKQMKKESAGFHKDWRIAKRTVTEEVVE